MGFTWEGAGVSEHWNKFQDVYDHAEYMLTLENQGMWEVTHGSKPECLQG